jgi:ABC-2 type transport system ATP-binding protein
MISVKNLSKRYNSKVALDNISFEIKPGEICGYIGTNGAGKTTTVKILNGTLSFDSGKVFISGFDITKNPLEVKSITGYVPELPNLFNSLTVTEFLNFISDIRNIPEDKRKRRLSYFSELLGYAENMKISIGNLSKGNKQKVIITSALLHNPDVILFDEPLSGLDANSIFILQDIIYKLAENGKTILYSSHLLDMIEKISTKIIILEEGKIILDKYSKELTGNSEYTTLENLFKDIQKDSEIKSFDYEYVFG